MRAPGRHRQTGWLIGIALVAAVTGVIQLLKPHAPPSGLGVLYLLAVLPTAVFWGTAVALGVSLLSAAALAFLFLDVTNPADGVALGVFVVTALLVSELSARSSREAREAERLAEEQAALRRIATLVARGVPPAELFSAVADEVAGLLPADSAFVAQLESDSSFVVLAVGGRITGGLAPGDRRQIEPPGPIAELVRTRGPARTDNFEQASPELQERIGRTGVRSAVVTPIVVEGQMWGVISAASTRGPFPADTERRMLNFTELMAAAIANTESRSALGVLADEQAALRRVATLVARGLPPTEIFAAVAEEVGRLVSFDGTRILRYESDETATVLAGWSDSVDVPPELGVGARLKLEGESVPTLVFRTGRPARIESYSNAAGPLTEQLQAAGVRSAAGAPIIVEGRLWGVMAAGSTKPEPLPRGVELRLAEFTELVATAIANAESRAGLARLAEQQAALHRVATLVANAAPPAELFAAVAEEVGQLLGTGLAGMARYEMDETVTVVATWAAEGEHGGPHPLVPGPWPIEGDDLASMISRTGRPVRIDSYDDVHGPIAAFVRDELGVVSSVA
ncbi:MAG: hypothetical protein QOH10_95, partial [Actinomycetota bacterium]|nr:hypothetical protein [Actinomycetota bacterium]